MRFSALNRIEVSQIESADAESLDIRPGQGFGISPRNDVARDTLDRRVLVPPAAAGANSAAMSKIDDTQYLKHPVRGDDYLPSIENARITLPGMKPSEP